ncbi:MAG: glycine--tRNA ligase [Patescibacteria group bacterium]
MSEQNLMGKIISLCRRRGFVFPSSEIYNGFSAIYDFGQYGVELENNIKRAWWRAMVQLNDNIVGLDSSIFMHPKIWEASGHVSGFSDPLVECKSCHSRLRCDHLLTEIGVQADEKMSVDEIDKLFSENKKNIKCLNCGKIDWTGVRKFNLLVKSNLGNFTEDWNKEPVYLRGETCQGIYVNYKNIIDTARVKIPFGVAQIGKVFRNEITARQFIFRTREFEQMEMQYFVHPNDEMKNYEEWRAKRWQYYLDLGIKEENLKWHKHENLVFYAKQAYDIEYKFPFGFGEIEGIHSRGEYDLSQHTKYSSVDLSYIDPITKEKFIPHIVETSAGVGRTVLAILTEAYTEENIGEEIRVVLKFNKNLAPIKIAVFPLLKNKPELVKKAKEIYDNLKISYMCEFDDNGNIGKRYRRQDEIGTPYCVTVDFDSLEDKKVTVRDRDTMKQERVGIGDLAEWVKEKFTQNLKISSQSLLSNKSNVKCKNNRTI